MVPRSENIEIVKNVFSWYIDKAIYSLRLIVCVRALSISVKLTREQRRKRGLFLCLSAFGRSADELDAYLDWTSVGLTIAVAACCGPACLPQEAAALSRVSPR